MKVLALVALCAVGAQAAQADASQPLPNRVVDEAAPAMTVFEAYQANIAPAPTAAAVASRPEFHGERDRRNPFAALTSAVGGAFADITSAVGSVATSIATVVTSGAGSVVSVASSGASSVVSVVTDALNPFDNNKKTTAPTATNTATPTAAAAADAPSSSSRNVAISGIAIGLAVVAATVLA